MRAMLRVVGLFSLLLAACAGGAPPGFSAGDRWTFPLVAPLEGGRLLVPVKINDRGPYLFLIDPDSPVSSIDRALVSDLELHAGWGPEILTEQDYKKRMMFAEVRTFGVGDLTVRNRTVWVHDLYTYVASGRHVRGVLGRDVIAESLILSYDRDRGVAWLATQGNLAPPHAARPIRFRNFRHRRLAQATINQQTRVLLHLDLGADRSMLWPKKLQQAGLPRVGVRERLVDELGSTREVDHGGMAGVVEAAGIESHGVLFLPYDDRRYHELELDGALGHNFFAPYNVTANWHTRTFWLSPRTTDIGGFSAERVRRWGPFPDGCRLPACVEIALVDGALRVTREAPAADLAYDILFEAVDAGGRSLGLPWVSATLPRGTREARAPDFDPAYAAAAGFRVLDVSPFPRACRPPGACILVLPPQL
jgi:hypothetical protein